LGECRAISTVPRAKRDRMAQSTLRLNSDGWFVECATAALRSRYCTERSTLTKIRVFVQSHRSTMRLRWRSNPGTVPRAQRPDGTLDITPKF
ncbi:MAG TPA: hypothetical protein VFD63_02035, partial [Pyrinomonadaceae bacterium]|nr:hypothetical protein [Pyrinomonadaceae bacterium]